MRLNIFRKKLILVMMLEVSIFLWFVHANGSPGKKDSILTGESLYQSCQVFACGIATEAVAIGDINNDQLADVLVITFHIPPVPPSLYVFLQDAESGTLNTPLDYPLGTEGGPESIEIGDLNNDGLNDAAIGHTTSNLEILYQDVSGTLNPGVRYYSADTMAIKIADYNADGLLDVAGVGWGTSTVSVWLQNTSGALNPPVTYSIFRDIYNDLEAGDVNNDGLTDLVAMCGMSSHPKIAVLLQNPGGGFSPAVYYNLNGNEEFYGAAIGDVTGDSLADIILSYGGIRPTSNIGVFVQNSSGTLNPAQTYAAYDNPEPVVVGDVNNDHRQDVIVAHLESSAISIYAQDSNGLLLPYQTYTIPYPSHYSRQGLAVGDINNNGGLDIALADYLNGLVVLYHNPVPTITVTSPNGGENWQVGTEHNITWTSTRGVGDVKIEYSVDNGSTWLEIIAAAENDGSYPWKIFSPVSNQCLIRISETDGSPVDTGDALFSLVPPPSIAIRVTSPNDGENWPADSSQVISWEAFGCSGDVVIELYKGGIFTDVIGTTPAWTGRFAWEIPPGITAGNDYRVRIYQGSLEDYSDNYFSILYPPFSPLVRADLNGDGNDDILWRYYTNEGNNVVWLRGSQGESLSAAQSPLKSHRQTGWGGSDMEIFANDTPSRESLVREDWELTVEQLTEQGITDGFSGYPEPETGQLERLTGPLAVNNNVSRHRKLTAAVMTAEVSDPREEPGAVELPPAVNINWKLCGTGDFNGDGSADLLWRNMANGENAVWLMNGTTRTAVRWLPAAANTDWNLCGTGDFNNDGKIDLIWRNTANGTNAVWYMDGVNRIGIGWLPTAVNLEWTLCGAGDFNNDGHVDLVWRHWWNGTNAVWFMDGVNRSDVGWLPPVWSTECILCGTGDFNNDGKVDLIWRECGSVNSIWYLDGLTLISTESLTTVTDPEWKIEN